MPSALEPGSAGIAAQASRPSPAQNSSSIGSNAPEKPKDDSPTAAGDIQVSCSPSGGGYVNNAGSSSIAPAGQTSPSNSGIPGPVLTVITPPVRTGPRTFSAIEAAGGAQPVVGQPNATLSVYLPSPIPPGLPVSGIFQQMVHGTSHGDAYGLSPDSIAVDSSSLVPVADVVPVFAPARQSVRVVLTGGLAGLALADLDAPRPAPLARAGRALLPIPAATATEVAELPDLAAALPSAPAPNAELPAAVSDRDTGETLAAQGRSKERRLAARIAAYGAACLALGSSALRAIAISRSHDQHKRAAG
jgi:hypothetical protein